MLHTTTDFFNKLATDIRSTYFPSENHGYTNNENYHAATRTIELFNNGCLTYRKLIGGLAKACNDTNYNINAIVEKYIVSFGEYQYTPKKP
jgi:hypothetical protein